MKLIIISMIVVSTLGAGAAVIEPGHELPVFGTRVTNDAWDIDARYARMIEWYHPCVKRKPVREVSKESIDKWKKNHIKYRSMVIDKKRIDKYEYLGELEDLLAVVCAELHRYGVKYNAAIPLSLINQFYSIDNHYKYWQNSRWPAKEFGRILAYCDSAMDKLDKIHEAEYDVWREENPAEWKQRNDAKLEREKQEVLEQKLKSLAARTADAERRALAAERFAEDAASLAEAAERKAAAAEGDASAARREADAARAEANRARMDAEFPRVDPGSGKWIFGW